MFTPQRALVRPRAIAPHCGEPLPLEELVQDYLEEWRKKSAGAGILVQVGGVAGSGKSTALAHLAAVLPDAATMTFVDGGSLEQALSRKLQREPVLLAMSGDALPEADAYFELAPWSQDDVVEYLLAAHPRECRQLVARIRQAEDKAALRGNPELWTCVLEEMCADPALENTRAAVERAVGKIFSRSDDRWYAEECCVAKLAGDLDRWIAMSGKLTREIPPDEFGLLRHEYSQLLLAASGLVDRLWTEHGEQMLRYHLPERLLRLVGPRIAASELLVHKLKSHLDRQNDLIHSAAASLLVAANVDWRPQGAGPLNLQGGHFAGVNWPGVILRSTASGRSKLSDADFTGAELSGADLTGALAVNAYFQRARLSAAKMVSLDATAAEFSNADLSGVSADRAVFKGANLTGAVFAEASLPGANFEKADLSHSNFIAANLSFAIFDGANIEEASFEGANLSGAALCMLPLYQASLVGARFQDALMQKCDLEGVELPGACFDSANLAGAYLTGSKMPRADFRGANLKDAGLADIDWEGADLRGADLRGCSFHMGSTRCGLVGSPYPMEGSRTGFYTDDYHDQTYKRPEEIRKANLRGADLRGAQLDGVDFYLVDLREARIDRKYQEHLQACRAILENRCPE